MTDEQILANIAARKAREAAAETAPKRNYVSPVERAQNRCRVKAYKSARRAVGLDDAIKTRDGSRIRGKIVKCEVGAIRVRGRSVIAQFEVTLETEGAYKHGPFCVESLPR